MEEGQVVDRVPGLRHKQRRYPNIDWDTHADIARLGGKPVLAAKGIRNSTVKSVRQYGKSGRPSFISDEGHIAVHFRNSTIGDDGERYGDVYLEWVPNTPAPSTPAPPTPQEEK